MPENDSIIGIDLGTSNSVVAVLENRAPRVIPNAEGSTRTPSVVAFMQGGEIYVGEMARRQGAIFPDRTIFASKRLMGMSQKTIDPHYVEFLPYTLTERDGFVAIRIDDEVYTPARVASEILKKLKSSAESYLNKKVHRAIITVPAYFDEHQRQCVVESAAMAELEVVRLLNEPAAAALAYGLGRTDHERVAVLDFGGGTFDLTILDIGENVFEVKCSIGDTQLGGDDIDEAVMHWIFEKFEELNGFCLVPDPLLLRRVKDAAEKAKCELSVAMQAVIQLPFLTMNEGNPIHFEQVITRPVFEQLVQPHVMDLLSIVAKGLNEVSLTPDDIEKVILVGGSMRIPVVQRMVEEYFGRAPFKGLNPDEIVAMGAATQGGVLEGKLREVVLLDVTPHSLGIETENGIVSRVIERNSTIPIRSSKIFTTTRDNQEMVYVHVLQGEGLKVSNCRSLGNFMLEGIQKTQAGMARIEVSFAINSSGMVEVSAVDLVTREAKSIAVTVSPGDRSEEGSDRRGDRDSTQELRRQNAARRLMGILPNPIPGSDVPPSTDGRQTQVLRPNEKGEFNMSTSPHMKNLYGTDMLRSVVHRHARKILPSPSVSPVQQMPPLPPAPDMIPLPPIDHYLDSDPFEEEPQSFRPVINVGSAKRVGSVPAEVKPQTETPPYARTPDAVLRHSLDLLERSVTTPDAIHEYLEVVEPLRKSVLGNPTYEMAHNAVLMSCVLGQVHESAQLLADLAAEKDLPISSAELYELLTLHVQHFPTEFSTRALRAELAVRMGLIHDAVEDYETICMNNTVSKPVYISALQDLYKGLLEQRDDPAVKFKIVKLYLRNKRYDDAIAMLQPMSRSMHLRERATKILALCFWQKGMHYLAWQRLQELAPTDEVKDMLYRLAVDMQHSDQSINALAVFNSLRELDPNYRDVNTRLARLGEAMKAGTNPNSRTPERMGTAPGKSGGEAPQSKVSTRQSQSIMEALRDSRFTPLEELNRGSMGIVFRARDKVLDELVALKILSDYLAYDDRAVERFKREARAAKRLSHPNIVRIHDMYEIGGKRLLSMEYIEGEDIKNILTSRGSMSAEQVIKIVLGVCNALTYAHHMGIVHRDIKPANIMLCPSGLVKVTDFGIAKFLNQTKPELSATQTMGTPLYMSPEQVRGDTVDYRTDIYSLGVTMYEMLVGKPPFLEGNIEYHHLYTLPASLPVTIPTVLSDIVFKCLEKDPNRRYQTVAELKVDLENIKES